MVKNLFVMQERPKLNLWFGKIPWRREWEPTPVFLPGEFHGQKNLAGHSPQGCKELDMTELLTDTHTSLSNCPMIGYFSDSKFAYVLLFTYKTFIFSTQFKSETFPKA